MDLFIIQMYCLLIPSLDPTIVPLHTRRYRQINTCCFDYHLSNSVLRAMLFLLPVVTVVYHVHLTLYLCVRMCVCVGGYCEKLSHTD